jgi:hypothetical protein
MSNRTKCLNREERLSPLRAASINRCWFMVLHAHGSQLFAAGAVGRK